MVHFEKAIAIVWTTPEAKAAEDWQKQLGEKLANHLTYCGFQSHLQDEGEATKADPQQRVPLKVLTSEGP
uniref:Uncharacterized protein n=1 Tax=Arundo donax TaxID=35708 RepID=A0A0A9ATZ0_ARUDO